MEDWHTYYVSDSEVLVHNTGTNPCAMAGKGAAGAAENTFNFTAKSWSKGSWNSAEESALKHFGKHGTEVGAKDVEQYMRKAEAFKQNLKGATKSPVNGAVEGVVRYKKAGKYIDLAPNGTIISFGKQ